MYESRRTIRGWLAPRCADVKRLTHRLERRRAEIETRRLTAEAMEPQPVAYDFWDYDFSAWDVFHA